MALITRDELAKLLGVSMTLIKTVEAAGKGPPAIRIGRVVRYDPAAIWAWLSEQSAR
jgi:predicted DNA-binding transcriptional regulator AlpA